MKTNLYTNTSKVSGVAGLIVTTLLVSYVSMNSTKIVDGAIALARKGLNEVQNAVHKGKKQYAVCERTYDGRIYDTGKRIWK